MLQSKPYAQPTKVNLYLYWVQTDCHKKLLFSCSHSCCCFSEFKIFGWGGGGGGGKHNKRHQAPVVQKVDSAIHWINCYPVDKY